MSSGQGFEPRTRNCERQKRSDLLPWALCSIFPGLMLCTQPQPQLMGTHVVWKSFWPWPQLSPRHLVFKTQPCFRSSLAN